MHIRTFFGLGLFVCLIWWHYLGFACVSGKLLLMLQSIKRGIAACPNDPKLHTCLVHFYMFGESPLSFLLSQSLSLLASLSFNLVSLSHKHTLLSFALVLHYAFRGIASVCDSASSLLQSVFSMVKVSGAKLISLIKKQREKGSLCSATVWCTHIEHTIAPSFRSFFMGEGGWSVWCELRWLRELNTCD